MKQQRRALLIGVTDYDDPAIESLPFIADDLDDLHKALTSAGYRVDRHPLEHGDRDRIDNAIEEFCRAAEPGQQLLIFLSGHGIHRDGRDYLLPSSASPKSRKFTERCLEIEFTGHVEDSRCGDVLIVVDACREGVRLNEKSGYSYVHRWSRQQRERSATRTIAYLYACSSGEYAHWKETADGTYSLFTHAFSRSLLDTSTPGNLTGLRDAIQARLETMSAELGLPLQRPYLDGDPDRNSQMILADRQVSAAASRTAPGWAEFASSHPVWDLIRAQPDSTIPAIASSLREAVVACVDIWSRQFQESRSMLHDDPWWDDEFAIRMHERLIWIMKHVLNPGKLAEADRPPLSPAEAALLVLLPFAQQLHRAWSAVDARLVIDSPDQTNDHYADFARYNEGQRRISRRLRRLEANNDLDHAKAVRWAAYHKWLVQRPQIYAPRVIENSLLAPLIPPESPADFLLREIISADQLTRLLRALRSDPQAVRSRDSATGFLSGADIPSGARTLAGGSPTEQIVRDRLLSLILLVAEAFTIDPATLPSIVTDHVGPAGGVEPSEVLRAVQLARWPARGRTRVLEAECPHQSVQLALAEYVSGVAGVLRSIDSMSDTDRTLGALQDLPTHASADLLRPLLGIDGLPRYDRMGFRFRLDDDRVQELLMGEQLYGDPALAVRELYQNALDACRYRTARTLHLNKAGRPTGPWEGQISFNQGTDSDGRAWLECRDNGIGMSEQELSSVFSHAGMRFADLPDFLEEQAIWMKEGIDFYPNSRFGIGVLSYFMLGDEIEVSTTRFNRDGSIGTRLMIKIDGPGSLCRIRTAKDSPQTGTVIRIYLRSDVSISCTDLLTRLLWVAEFAVTASDGITTCNWQPGELSLRAPITGDDTKIGVGVPRNASITPHRRSAIPSSVAHLWWCDGPGGVLVDGLWVGESTFGYIINLTGRTAPKLTVDRRRILSMASERVHELLENGIRDLISTRRADFIGLEWLGNVSRQNVQLADSIAERMINEEVALKTDTGITVQTTLVGVFPPDVQLFGLQEQSVRGRSNYASRRVTLDYSTKGIGSWRLFHYLRAWCVSGMRLGSEPLSTIRALPSDAFILSREFDGNLPFIDPAQAVTVTHVMVASVSVRWTPQRVAERLTTLGLDTPDFEWPDFQLTTEDARLFSRDLETRLDRNTIYEPRRVKQQQWLDLSQPLPIGHIFSAAVKLRRSPGQVAKRLTEMHLQVPDFDWPTTPTDDADAQLWSHDFDGFDPWLDPAEAIAVGRIFLAAIQQDRTPQQVAGRMTEIGLPVPDFDWPSEPVSESDSRLLQYFLDSDRLTPAISVSAGYFVPTGIVFSLAEELQRSPREVADRLASFHLSVLNIDWPRDLVSELDAQLLARRTDIYGKSSRRVSSDWIEPTQPIPTAHVFITAARLDRPPQKIAQRLVELHLPVRDFAWPTELVSALDAQLLSRDLDGQDPWIDPTRPVSVDFVIGAAGEQRRSPREVAESLTRLGVSLPDFDWPRESLPHAYIDLTDQRSFGPQRTEFDQAIRAGTIFSIAARLKSSPQEVVDYIRNIGLRLADCDWPTCPIDGDDLYEFFTHPGVTSALSLPLELGILVPSVNGRRSIGHTAMQLRQIGLEFSEDIELIPEDLPKSDRHFRHNADLDDIHME